MSAQAGWYDDGSGRHRWWDGQRWTDNYADQQRDHSGVANHFSNVSSALVSNVTARHDPSLEPGTLWSAIGKPLTGIGVGRYRLTEEYLFFEKGTLSTKSQQIRVHEIFDVDATQSMTQKASGCGHHHAAGAAAQRKRARHDRRHPQLPRRCRHHQSGVGRCAAARDKTAEHPAFQLHRQCCGDAAPIGGCCVCGGGGCRWCSRRRAERGAGEVGGVASAGCS